jgi:hypothetical protein
LLSSTLAIIFPISFVVFGMSQNKTDQHRLRRIVDFADQPVVIPLDVEDCADAGQIRMREITARISQILPARLRSDFVPASQWLFSVWMLFPKLSEFFETDHVHNSSPLEMCVFHASLSTPR